jgi:hypothetical protein
MKRIAIISFSNIESDPRVLRQIRSLRDLAVITVVGFGERPDQDVTFESLKRHRLSLVEKVLFGLLLLFRMHDTYYWNKRHVAEAKAYIDQHQYDFDYVIANDIDALPLAFCFATNCKVVYDAHEYSPRELEDSFVWRLLFQVYNNSVCRKYIHRTYRLSTVSQGIADEYRKEFGRDAFLIVNAAMKHDLPVSLTDENTVKLIHHGAAMPERHLEQMIDTMAHLDDRYTLDFMLTRMNSAYGDALRRTASKDARIRFIDPVPFDQIVPTLNSYDVGVYILPPTNFNAKFALPNKFFEFIQARLAIAIGPSPEMARYVQQYKNGVVAQDFSAASLAASLKQLTRDDIIRMKRASDRAAAALSFEACCKDTLLRMVDIDPS